MTTEDYLILTSKDNIENYFEDIEKIYISNGWGRAYSREALQKMFDGPYYLVAISSAGVAGFLRAFTDGVVVTHLSEIVVDPAFQRQGIGGILVRKFLQDVAHTTIYAEALNPQAGGLLQQHGFVESRQLRVFTRKSLRVNQG